LYCSMTGPLPDNRAQSGRPGIALDRLVDPSFGARPRCDWSSATKNIPL
jgi:hypothetical protein